MTLAMEQTTEEQALVGAVLSQRWRLVRYIGSGGLGIVYEAQPTRGEGSVAVKLLRQEMCHEQQIVERFVNEANASMRVQHPGIVKVYEAARAEDGTPYLVMELLHGEALFDRMSRGRLPVEQAAPIVHEVLMVLQAAHAAGVVHRDLKPENIFLLRTADGHVQVKVLDLGIARVLDAAGGLSRRTRTGMLLGTPGYMSPEQASNAKGADLRTDLWSVGVILYEMLTGICAFEADNEFARLVAVLHQSPRPIEEVAPQYAHWKPFFQRALARDLTLRFQSAKEMADALVAVSRGGQVPLSTQHYRAIKLSEPPPGGELSRAAHPTPAPQGREALNTAVSPRAPAIGVAHSRPPPSVQVVQPTGYRVSLVVLAVAVVFSLMLGFLAGFFLAQLGV